MATHEPSSGGVGPSPAGRRGSDLHDGADYSPSPRRGTGAGEGSPPWIGSGLRRKETERFIQGAGTFTDDVQLPHQAYAAFVRSYAAHAVIEGIELDAARALPGVLGIFTASDWDDLLGAQGRAPWPLAVGKVRHVGEPIAVVVAESRYLAQDAANAVVVHLEPLPPVLDPEAAMADDAPRVFD